MDPTQLIIAIFGAGGAGAALISLTKGLFKWWTGSAQRELERNTNIAMQRVKAIEARDAAEAERDQADVLRRLAEEHVSILKRQLIELGEVPRERKGN